MIPVVVANETGMMTQVFNDNLTTAEQINRIVLGVTAYAQTKLVNDKYAFDSGVDTAKFTAEQLEKIKEEAINMDKAIKKAITDFAKVVDNPDGDEASDTEGVTAPDTVTE